MKIKNIILLTLLCVLPFSKGQAGLFGNPEKTIKYANRAATYGSMGLIALVAAAWFGRDFVLDKYWSRCCTELWQLSNNQQLTPKELQRQKDLTAKLNFLKKLEELLSIAALAGCGTGLALHAGSQTLCTLVSFITQKNRSNKLAKLSGFFLAPFIVSIVSSAITLPILRAYQNKKASNIKNELDRIYPTIYKKYTPSPKEAQKLVGTMVEKGSLTVWMPTKPTLSKEQMKIKEELQEKLLTYKYAKKGIDKTNSFMKKFALALSIPVIISMYLYLKEGLKEIKMGQQNKKK